MSQIDKVKEYVIKNISDLLPKCRIKYVYKHTPDTHFFQVVGLSIYDNKQAMVLVDDIYQEIENMYPEIDIAIVDASAISDLSNSTTIYNGISTIGKNVSREIEQSIDSLHGFNSFINKSTIKLFESDVKLYSENLLFDNVLHSLYNNLSMMNENVFINFDIESSFIEESNSNFVFSTPEIKSKLQYNYEIYSDMELLQAA